MQDSAHSAKQQLLAEKKKSQTSVNLFLKKKLVANKNEATSPNPLTAAPNQLAKGPGAGGGLGSRATGAPTQTASLSKTMVLQSGAQRPSNALIAEQPDSMKLGCPNKNMGRMSVLFQKADTLRHLGGIQAGRRATKVQTNAEIISAFIKNLNIQAQAEKMSKESNRTMFKRASKKVDTKVERIDRVRNLDIIYPHFIIPCHSRFKLVWDMVIIVLIVWMAVYLPWELANPSDKIVVLDYIIQFFFILDILLSLRTTYYTRDMDEIVEQRLIAKHYIRSLNFVIDLVSAIPFDLIAGSGSQNATILQVLKFIKVLRLLRLGKFMRQIQMSEFLVWLQLVKYLFKFLLILHWMALLWQTLSQSQVPGSEEQTQYNSWLPSNYRIIIQSSRLDGNQLAVDYYSTYTKMHRYIFNFYNMVIIILGGEIAPITSEQSFLAVSFACIGQLTIAVLFANMIVILYKIKRHQVEKEHHFEGLLNSMKGKEIPVLLKQKAIEYFEFCWKKQVVFNKELNDFSSLSQQLQKELQFFIHREVIINVPLFSQLDQQQVLMVIQKLRTKVFMPEETLVEQGQVLNEMYFISEGVIKILKKEQDQVYEESYLQKGDHLGEMSILSFWSSDFDAVSQTFTILQQFTRKDFEQIKKDFPSIDNNLKLGLQLYKLEDQEIVSENLLRLDPFENLSSDQMKIIYTNYMKDLYLDPNVIIIVPREFLNALYVIFKGVVRVYDFSIKDANLFQNSSLKEISVDENIYDMVDSSANVELKQKLGQKVSLLGRLQKFDYFGMVPLNAGETKMGNENLYFITDTTCQLGVITHKILQQLKYDFPDIYHVVADNLQRMSSVLSQQKIDHFMKDRNKRLNNFLINTIFKFENQQALDSRQSKIDYQILKALNLMQQQAKQLNMFTENYFQLMD